jgi:uncharacterized protein (TIGR02145 family)
MTQEEFHKRYQYSPTKDCLGEGGFAKVFKAYDTHLNKWVAIKMAEVKSGLEHVRLNHEVEIVNKLPTHPNIARYEECYTFSSFTGEYDFAVLQYYESGNLQQLLETKQLPEQQKDSILLQILAGIEFLHNQGIIHRDLKPQNILIVNRNGEYIPKITDFGISKKLDTNKSSVFTNSLVGVGTLAYASPEHLRGQTIKKNTDLWSFGVIVCWIFTGKLPFTSGNQAVTSEAGRIELFKQISGGDVFALIQQLPSVWSELVKQCIVVDNEKRINNASNCLNIISGMINRFENKTTVIEENTVTDIDGNVYKTVQIGNQIWMAENLKVSRYRNGDLIPNVTDSEIWRDYLMSGAYCFYENNSAYNAEYGKLYNWYVVNDNRIIAPVGWHIPTLNEWEILIDYLGGGEIAGGRLKETGTLHWELPNENATNESGFTALPGGSTSNFDKPFYGLGNVGSWWSSLPYDEQFAWSIGINLQGCVEQDYFNIEHGLSIRCIKNVDDESVIDIEGFKYKILCRQGSQKIMVQIKNKIIELDGFNKEGFREAYKKANINAYANMQCYEHIKKLSNLPKNGKFVDVEIIKCITEKSENSGFVRMITESGKSIYIDTLNQLVHNGKKETADLIRVTRETSPLFGKFVLRGLPINPELVGNVSDIVEKLYNKEFTTEEVEVLVLPYKEDGYLTKKDAYDSLITRKVFRITIF